MTTRFPAFLAALLILAGSPAAAQDIALDPLDGVDFSSAVIRRTGTLQLDAFVPEPPRLAPYVVVPHLSDDVRRMIELAIEHNDEAEFKAVANLARTANPEAKPQIAAFEKTFKDRNFYLAEQKRLREEARILAAGVFDLWKGEGQLGFTRATGNSDTIGLTAAVRAEREGLRWTHKAVLQADYQRDGIRVTREQYLASYSPRLQIRDQFYSFGLLQFERDRFQGFNSRYTVSAGVGYKFVDTPAVRLSFEGGPAIRWVDYIDQVDDTEWSALSTLSAAWRVAPKVKLSENASAYVAEVNSTFVSNTSVEADVTSRLKTRLSYTVEHETSPAATAMKTDTISRFTIVYGF